MPRKQPTEKSLIKTGKQLELSIVRTGGHVLDSVQKAVRRYGPMAITVIEDAFQGFGGVPRVSEVIDIADQLQRALVDAGLDEAARDFRRGFAPVRQAANKYFEQFGYKPSLSSIDVESLNALASFHEAQFLDLFDRRLVQPLADQVINGVIGLRDTDTIVSSLRNFMDEQGIITRAGVGFTDPQLETLVHDAYRRQGRQVKAEQANRLNMQVIWFQGPDDKITSEQCQFMLNYDAHGVPGMWLDEEFTAENINDLMNDDLLKENPKLVGGHWNCRHSVNYIPLSYAIDKGFQIDLDENAEDYADV